MRSLRTSLVLLAAVSATNSWATAQTLQFEALSNITTFAADTASGMPMAASTPAGILTPPFIQDSASSPTVGGGIVLTGDAQNLVLSSSVRVSTTQPPAFAIAGPIDGVFRVQLSPPNFVRILVSTQSGVEAGGVADVSVDVFDDGSEEIGSGVGAQSFFLDVPRDATDVPIRLRSFVSAKANGPSTPTTSASLQVQVRLAPRVCDTTAITSEICGFGAGSSVLPVPGFDGSLTFRVLDVPTLASDYFLVLGFQQAPTPLPFPLFSGTCQLVPTPDILLPFPNGAGFLQTLSISLVDVPSPFTFYTQALGINPATGVAQLGRVTQVDC